MQQLFGTLELKEITTIAKMSEIEFYFLSRFENEKSSYFHLFGMKFASNMIVGLMVHAARTQVRVHKLLTTCFLKLTLLYLANSNMPLAAPSFMQSAISKGCVIGKCV